MTRIHAHPEFMYILSHVVDIVADHCLATSIMTPFKFVTNRSV